MVNEGTVGSINTLVRFCARRDVPALTREALQAAAGARADVAILFGGTILAGADVFASAIREQDATMQQRMDASVRLYANPATQLINYASHQTTVALIDGQLR